MSTPIDRAEIRVGDTIKSVRHDIDVRIERLGTVAFTSSGNILTGEHAYIHNSAWAGDYTFYLIDRPKPELPTNEGAIIILENSPVEGGPVPLILREGKWEYLSGDSHYHPQAVGQYQWRAGEVVAVEP